LNVFDGENVRVASQCRLNECIFDGRKSPVGSLGFEIWTGPVGLGFCLDCSCTNDCVKRDVSITPDCLICPVGG
jgi:hypothetical protein